MNYESYNLYDDFDASAAITASDEMTFKFEVLILSLKSKMFGMLFVFTALVCALFCLGFLYFAPARIELSFGIYSLIPSLFVILLFLVAAVLRCVLTLHETRELARFALSRQIQTQIRVEQDLAKESLE